MNSQASDMSNIDVVIIGAGPSGSVAGALLVQKGYRVHIVEKQHFPRFSIGESLLPQCMEFLEEANMIDALHSSADQLEFQFKNGAAFARGETYTDFNFAEKFSEGPTTTYQVRRADFDHLLAQESEKKGVTITWGHEITSINVDGERPVLGARDEDGKDYELQCRYVLDASGFGRVLPRLLDLNRPSKFPVRSSLFTHVEDNMVPEEFDREKILITIHPDHKDVWFWLIPFSDGRSSFGVVAKNEFFDSLPKDSEERLQTIIAQVPSLKKILRNAKFDTPVRQITGYSSDVTSLWGNNFALLGNAGEFLDPVFSSGVTIAMKSASMVSSLLDRKFKGETIDWEKEYGEPLRAGVDTFRVFVEAWYDGRFQDIIFAPKPTIKIREMICSILAGYAWDIKNPYVKDSERRMNALAEVCQTT